jgi:hypothetical protein
MSVEKTRPRKEIEAGPPVARLGHGHIIIGVEPDRASYRVFLLDDMSEAGKVLATHGPYQSH